MFKLNKRQMKTADAALPSSAKPSDKYSFLTCVEIKSDSITASNGIILIRRKIEDHPENVLVIEADGFKGVHPGNDGIVTFIPDGSGSVRAFGADAAILPTTPKKYPDYNTLVPETVPDGRITLKKETLLNLLNLLDESEEFIRFNFYKNLNAVKFTAGDGLDYSGMAGLVAGCEDKGND